MKYTIIEIKSRKIVGEQEILDCIITCDGLKTKLNLNQDKLKDFKKKVKEGVKFPNVELSDDLYDVRIREGNHRIQAHKEEGKHINATITRDLMEFKWIPKRFTAINYNRIMDGIKKGKEKFKKKEITNAT